MTQDHSTLYKLIILYMLDRVDFKLTHAQISSFILEKEYTDYMTLQHVLSDLLETELIKSETMRNRIYYSITGEGQNVLSYFGSRINSETISAINSYLKEKNMELKNESSITANYDKSVIGGYDAELVAREKDIELVRIKLNVPTEDMAETLCDNWHAKNQQIYGYLMQELF